MTEATIQQPDEVTNTRLDYLYRDASNHKQWHHVIVAGELSFAALAPYLDEGIYFIPQQVGLEALQARFGDTLTTEDHPWHELYAENVAFTKIAPTLAVTAHDLLERFRTIWWDNIAASEALGIPVEPLFSPGQFTATPGHSAEEKALMANTLATFAKAGFPQAQFTPALYQHLSTRLYGHIAHFNRQGFYDTWFQGCQKCLAWLTYVVNGGLIPWASGDPAVTWSDVEEAFRRWLEGSGLLTHYERLCAQETKAAQHDEKAQAEH